MRFGNVLRSRGSVIPVFEKQIAAGGPVTVTHPEMERYFMSIPEAVRLVLHGGAIGDSGDLCILDMGEQVRIVDLAENMIRMTGKVPYDEVDIQFTGIRAGEKLYEELFTEEEARTLRKVEKIFVSQPDGHGGARLEEVLPALREAALGCEREGISELLRRIVPSYCPTAPTAPVAAQPARPRWWGANMAQIFPAHSSGTDSTAPLVRKSRRGGPKARLRAVPPLSTSTCESRGCRLTSATKSRKAQH